MFVAFNAASKRVGNERDAKIVSQIDNDPVKTEKLLYGKNDINSREVYLWTAIKYFS
jgi:hypothetical protein